MYRDAFSSLTFISHHRTKINIQFLSNDNYLNIESKLKRIEKVHTRFFLNDIKGKNTSYIKVYTEVGCLPLHIIRKYVF